MKRRLDPKICGCCGKVFQPRTKTSIYCGLSCRGSAKSSVMKQGHLSKHDPNLSDRLRECLNYNPDTGDITWTVRTSFRVKPGDIAGRIICGNLGNKYILISIKGLRILAHVAAWVMYYGKLPNGDVDHENGNGCDNRIKNLRDTSHSNNAFNQKSGRSITGYKGVHPIKGCSTFQARIMKDGKNIHIGCFRTVEEAHEARVKKEKELGVYEFCESGRRRSTPS